MPRPPQMPRKEGHHVLPSLPGEGQSLPAHLLLPGLTVGCCPDEALRRGPWVEGTTYGNGSCHAHRSCVCTHCTLACACMYVGTRVPATHTGQVCVHIAHCTHVCAQVCACRNWPSWVETACDRLCVQESPCITGVSSEVVTWVSTQKIDHVVVQSLSHV